jgi:hypothetical protein
LPTFSQPKRGLQAAEALARWSNPALYAELVRLAGTTDLPTLGICDRHIGDRNRLEEYRKKREAAESAFKDCLRKGELLSSGIAEFGGVRQVLHPNFYDVGMVDHDFDEAAANGLVYQQTEFFELRAIPSNIESIPHWLEELRGETRPGVFNHSSDYRHISFNGKEYSFSPLHGRILKVLHKAYRSGDPWMYGKKVLEQAGSPQEKMGDALKSRKDWRDLVESDGKGMYRLRMEPPKAGR